MLEIKQLGLQDYQTVQQRMQHFTTVRDADNKDQIWFLQHPSVYTMGCSMKDQLPPKTTTTEIPFVLSSRGGQVTYHAPGQLICYLMLNLRRYQLSLRSLINLIETTVIAYLASLNLKAESKKEAPGVYINGRKIASLGLRISRGFSYHGFSLNVDVDLAPFNDVVICGAPDVRATRLIDYIPTIDITQVTEALSASLFKQLTTASQFPKATTDPL